MTKADTDALVKALGMTGTISNTMRIALAHVIATQELTAVLATLAAQNVEDGPRIDRTLDLTAQALKAA